METTAVVIGSGNVATHFARALQHAGAKILCIYSRTAEHAAEAGKLLGIPYTSEWEQVPENGNLYLYAVSDAALPGLLARELAPQALHVHTAGSISLDVFPASKPNHGVIYPLQTFSKDKELNFSEVPLLVEAVTPEITNKLINFAGTLSTAVYTIKSAQRQKIHLAAVFACNFVNHMYAIADEILCASDIPVGVLRPLIAETASKIKTLSPADAQTGPAVRNDKLIIDKHLTLLKQYPELHEIYNMISNSIINRKKSQDSACKN